MNETKPCPQCGKPSEAAFRPFCSARCRQVDLGRWLSGSYAIPTETYAEEEEFSLPQPDESEH